jgi:hypothetical protein
MVDLATILAAIRAATSAVGLFDKITDQVERFITKTTAPPIPKEHRMKLTNEEDAIVSREHGQVTQRITASDLKSLPESQLRHVIVFEKSMKNHYSIWEKVYPDLSLVDSPIQKVKLEKQLEGIIRDMKGDLEDILSFLESCGLYLDDHYLNIRHLIKNV